MRTQIFDYLHKEPFSSKRGIELILYHVTLFNKPTQEILIPRIPGDTSIGEEVKTNRICFDTKYYSMFACIGDI